MNQQLLKIAIKSIRGASGNKKRLSTLGVRQGSPQKRVSRHLVQFYS